MSVTCQPEQSLFSSFVNPPSDPSSLISKKINYRLGTFTNEMDYTEIKTEKMENDIDLGSQERAKLFRNKRMMASIPFQYMLPLLEYSILLKLYNYKAFDNLFVLFF